MSGTNFCMVGWFSGKTVNIRF